MKSSNPRRTDSQDSERNEPSEFTAADNTDSGHDAGDADSAGEASSRYSFRFESNVTRLAGAVSIADQARMKVHELTAGVILEHALQHNGADVPEGDDPYACATIAGSVARFTAGVEEESSDDSEGDPSMPFPDGQSTWDGVPFDEYDEFETCTDLVVIPRSSKTLVRYDREFARSLLPPAFDPEPHPSDEVPEDLPDFPGFDPNSDFSQWVHDNVFTEDVAEAATIFGTSTPRTYRQLTTAMTLIHGLPRFAERVRHGEFAQAHVDVAADLCQTVAFRFLPTLDDYLAERRADVTSETFRAGLRKIIQLLQPAEDRSETAARRRRVDVEAFKDGSACMTVRGPADEVYASYQRIQGMARAIYAGQTNTFNLAPGLEIIDDRTITGLMFDIVTRPQPKLSIKVKVIDPVTGVQGTREGPLLDDNGNLLFTADAHGVSGLVDCADSASPRASGSAFFPDGMPSSGIEGNATGEFEIVVAMPTSQWWLAGQAAVVATVPFLTLIGASTLPGTLPDGSPIPAEVARRIAARSKSLTRILTDPATGTPVDARATTYAVPKSVRKTLIAQWAICTVPGCTRSAEKSEIDHVEPFFHLDPLKGGLTRFGNLHPLCKKHHAVKTARKYSVRMPESGLVEYEFAHGVKTTVKAPEQPIDVEQAHELQVLAGKRLKKWRIPKNEVPPLPYVLELMPGETTIRERDEARRQAEKIAADRRRRDECYQRGRASRQRLMIERMLDWEHAVFQPCLPPGSDRVTMKRLPWNRRRRYDSRRKIREVKERRGSKYEFVRFDSRPRDVKVQWEHDLANDPPPF